MFSSDNLFYKKKQSYMAQSDKCILWRYCFKHHLILGREGLDIINLKIKSHFSVAPLVLLKCKTCSNCVHDPTFGLPSLMPSSGVI